MSKVYAVIQPAFRDDGSSAGLIAPFVSLFHMAKYERVCGYSLGQKIHFFDTLDAAQDFIMPRTGSKRRDMNLRLQNAIIEFEVAHDQVTSYGSIYTVSDTREVMRKTELEGDFFEKVKVPVWDERDIASGEVSNNAGAVLMRELKISRHYSTHKNEMDAATKMKQEEMLEMKLSSLSMALSIPAFVATFVLVENPWAALALRVTTVACFVSSLRSSMDLVYRAEKRNEEYIEDNILSSQEEAVAPVPRREPKTTAAISGGMGSSACTIFRNGAKAIAKNGVVTYIDQDGKKTVQDGNGYVGSGRYDEDGRYNVDFKVVNRK